MGHFFHKLLNTVAYFAFFSSNAYAVIAFPDEVKRTYLTAAPFASGIWGLIHLLFFGFVIYQWIPGSEEKDEIIHNAFGWNFIFTGLLTSAWLQFLVSDYLIVAWIISLLLASSVSVIYYRLSFEKAVATSFVEFLFTRAPISLFTGWSTYIVWLSFSIAFTSEVSEAGPTLWDRAVVFAFFLLSIPSAVFFTRSRWQHNGYGDPIANLALGWAILAVAVYQGDFWIKAIGYFSAFSVLLASIEPMIWGSSSTTRFVDVESAAESERTPLVRGSN
ncbi:hypothetical protein HK098_005459 [Nowakowskiella sp. JEL0407]|nr:hypothetical protein HK098_005459 [Nowakowskiella sp. JEL0407]